jgi:hypothetical protein
MTSSAVENEATRIADAIVKLVERIDGPVTFAQIQRDIAGFAAKTAPAWDYIIENGAKETVIWTGMTEAGLAALEKLISGRRVAFQSVNVWPYLLGDVLVDHPDWQPVVLLPAKGANLSIPQWLMRVPPDKRNQLVTFAKKKGKRGYRPLKPAALRFNADQFSI